MKSPNRPRYIASICALLLLCTPYSLAQVVGQKLNIGEEVPFFRSTDLNGNTFRLSDHIGKIIVLEWTNPVDEPFVLKFYQNGDMQDFQLNAINEGVVWVTINSTGERHRSYLSKEESQQWVSENGVNSIWLMDESGTIGRLFGATRTPHFFIIDREGKLAYQGAIDSIRDTKPSSIPVAENYVNNAIRNLLDGVPVALPQTISYGQSVKYDTWPEPEIKLWNNYLVESNDWIDTGFWLGWINVKEEPWVFVQGLGKHVYIADDSGWVYSIK